MRICYPSCEIVNTVYDVLWEHLRTKGVKIQPLEWCVAKGTIVQVEAVYVDVGLQGATPKKQRPPEGGLAPVHRSERGDLWITLGYTVPNVNTLDASQPIIDRPQCHSPRLSHLSRELKPMQIINSRPKANNTTEIAIAAIFTPRTIAVSPPPTNSRMAKPPSISRFSVVLLCRFISAPFD